MRLPRSRLPSLGGQVARNDRKGEIARNDNIAIPPPVRAEVWVNAQFGSRPVAAYCP
jgi:hypothetical protein